MTYIALKNYLYLPEQVQKNKADINTLRNAFQLEYSDTTEYFKPQIVSVDGVAYIALRDTPFKGHYPPTSPDYWAIFASGPQGPQGPAGKDGVNGKDGKDGATGPQGPQGPKGDTGATGPVGPAGPQGYTGDVGPRGPQGIQGPTGATGPRGPEGPQGPVGPQGANGAINDWQDATLDTELADGTYLIKMISKTTGEDPNPAIVWILDGQSTQFIIDTGAAAIFNFSMQKYINFAYKKIATEFSVVVFTKSDAQINIDFAVQQTADSYSGYKYIKLK